MWLQVGFLWLHSRATAGMILPLFTFCLLGKCCPHTHGPRQPQRFRASRFIGVAIGVNVPNMSKGSRTVGTPHSEPLLMANNEIHPKMPLK